MPQLTKVPTSQVGPWDPYNTQFAIPPALDANKTHPNPSFIKKNDFEKGILKRWLTRAQEMTQRAGIYA